VPVWVFIVMAAVGLTMSALPSIAFINARRWSKEITAASRRHGVPEALIYGVIAAESSFNPLAMAKTSTARGLMQVTKGAAADVGADWNRLSEPVANINAGTAYLALMLRQFNGDQLQAIRAYYEGAGNRRKHSDASTANDNPRLMDESAAYANKVMGYATAFNQKYQAGWDVA
jgi:soluble lytic murein transglycosylase-like protein